LIIYHFSIAKLTAFDVAAGSSSPLTGDAVARRVQGLMRDALDAHTQAQPHANGLRSLSQIGISTDPISGQLKIDDAQLDKALKDHLPQVQDLLTGSTQEGENAESTRERSGEKSGGLLAQVLEAVNAITGHGGRTGLLEAASEGAQRSATLLDVEYRETSTRIDQRMETWRQQFVALDATVARMSAIGNYLSQQLASLGNMNSAKN